MTKLWLDDERDPVVNLPDMGWMRGRPAGDFEGWVWVRTSDEAIELLKTRQVTIASFDHDIGEEEIVGNGYMVLNWLDEQSFLDETFPIPELHVHSSNSGARVRMELAVKALERRRAERETDSDFDVRGGC